MILAEGIRPYTEQAMKIEVVPWIRDYVCKMNNLYTELTLEKINDKPTGAEAKELRNYQELFVSSKNDEVTRETNDLGIIRSFANLFQNNNEKRIKHQNVKIQIAKGSKILFKGDSGMGKTTLMKKITWDWANRIFKAFIIVFFVFLKFVNPGDHIENVIIEQNPYIMGLGITPEKLRSILDVFGNRCLLVLDGLDEHALGQNEDVLQIIRGQKLLDCHVIVSSRPHSTRNIQHYFQTIVRIEGFTYQKADVFASKILDSKTKIQTVLEFNPADFSEDVPIHKCPILLSFMCLLVKADDIDLSSKSIDTGEIYAKMVRCLYKKFTIKKKNRI